MPSVEKKTKSQHLIKKGVCAERQIKLVCANSRWKRGKHWIWIDILVWESMNKVTFVHIWHIWGLEMVGLSDFWIKNKITKSDISKSPRRFMKERLANWSAEYIYTLGKKDIYWARKKSALKHTPHYMMYGIYFSYVIWMKKRNPCREVCIRGPTQDLLRV